MAPRSTLDSRSRNPGVFLGPSLSLDHTPLPILKVCPFYHLPPGPPAQPTCSPAICSTSNDQSPICKRNQVMLHPYLNPAAAPTPLPIIFCFLLMLTRHHRMGFTFKSTPPLYPRLTTLDVLQVREHSRLFPASEPHTLCSFCRETCPAPPHSPGLQAPRALPRTSV